MQDNNALAMELKPCPFCGSTEQEVGGQFIDETYVLCSCNAAGPTCKTGAEAIAAWNTRTQPAPASGEVGEPVAWMYCDHDPVEPWIHVQLERASKNTHPYCEETPLYTADMLERLAGAGEKPDTVIEVSDAPEAWERVGFLEEKLKQAETERDEWKERAMSERIARITQDTLSIQQPGDQERVAFAIIEGSAGTRAAEHAREFQTANWTDALRSARAAIAVMQSTKDNNP